MKEDLRKQDLMHWILKTETSHLSNVNITSQNQLQDKILHGQ